MEPLIGLTLPDTVYFTSLFVNGKYFIMHGGSFTLRSIHLLPTCLVENTDSMMMNTLREFQARYGGELREYKLERVTT